MESLERYGGTPWAVPIFIHALRDTEDIIRYDALERLERSSGPSTCSGKPLVLTSEMRPNLIALVAANAQHETDDGFYVESLRVLESLGAVQEALPVFLKAAADTDSSVRETARSALERAGFEFAPPNH